jgi:hypothetical protein
MASQFTLDVFCKYHLYLSTDMAKLRPSVYRNARYKPDVLNHPTSATRFRKGEHLSSDDMTKFLLEHYISDEDRRLDGFLT